MMAPLAEESIYKSLCYWIPGSVDEDTRNTSALITAQYEFFLHGRERFQHFQEELDFHKIEVTRYSYDDIMERYISRELEPWVSNG